MVNAIFYILRTGGSWRQLPHDFPPWQSVYGRFRRWRRKKVWEKLVTVLTATAREGMGRKANPSVLIIDSQSVRTTEKGGSAVTTGPSGSQAVSDTLRWIRKATSSR